MSATKTTKTTHRPSFRVKDTNDFWRVDIAGTYYCDDRQETPPRDVLAKFAAHERQGYHHDCLQCQNQHGVEEMAWLALYDENHLDENHLECEETIALEGGEIIYRAYHTGHCDCPKYDEIPF